MSNEKHYQTTERTPALRLRSDSYDDTPNQWVYVEERSGERDWKTIGSAELGYGPADLRGVLDGEDDGDGDDENVAAEWSHTEYRMNGDRIRVDRRLVVESDEPESGSLLVTLEKRREQVLGSGREEYGWQEQETWTFEAPRLATDGGTTTDDDTEVQKHLGYVAGAVARANEDTARAVTQAGGLVDTRHPDMNLRSIHDKLIDAAGSLGGALDETERTMDRLDPGYGQPTPRQLKSEHADRFEERYDGPVFYVACELLEYNRREWLHRKPDTQGAEDVRRHGLVTNQRTMLDQLQAAWDAYEGDGDGDGDEGGDGDGC